MPLIFSDYAISSIGARKERDIFMDDLIFRFRQWMQGRYGRDELYTGLLVLYLILLVLNMFFRKWMIFGILSWPVLIVAFYRYFSRNIEQRELENRQFLSLLGRFKGGLDKVDWQTGSIRRTPRASAGTSRKPSGGPSVWVRLKEFPQKKYASCPQCRATLRLPRKRGKHTVRCPRCGNRFGVNILIGSK